MKIKFNKTTGRLSITLDVKTEDLKQLFKHTPAQDTLCVVDSKGNETPIFRVGIGEPAELTSFGAKFNKSTASGKAFLDIATPHKTLEEVTEVSMNALNNLREMEEQWKPAIKTLNAQLKATAESIDVVEEA